jgi:archaemetzincin
LGTPDSYNLLISPIGDFDPALLEEIGDRLYQVYGFPSQVAPALLDLSFAYHPAREQYHSTPILNKIGSSAPKGYLKVLVLTHVDLFIPILTYVFGEAQLDGKACIVSTFRLSEDNFSIDPEKTFNKRIIKESIHEIGHTFNLRHCKNKECIMNYCHSVKEVDLRKDFLCRYCKVLLEDEKNRLVCTRPAE